MAEVIPLRGILYNPGKIKNLGDVITPPFDVISRKDQHQFYERSPFNVVRLILGKTSKFDTRGHNPHSRAADYFNKWMADDILRQDVLPTFYIAAFEFPSEGRRVTRYGLIARVRLSPFSDGIVLPHERTFTNVKSERLALMQLCHANFSPIFSMYSDGDSSLHRYITGISADATADIDIKDHDGNGHRLWRITASGVLEQISAALATKKLYIADGHHRYETALNYRDWLRASDPEFHTSHPANFVLMYLCSMNDPGLIIRPAHRMLKQVPKSALGSFISRARDFFEVIPIPFKENERNKILYEFSDMLNSQSANKSIGVFLKRRRKFFILRLNHPQSMEALFGPELDPVLRDLDVTVLTRLIFMELLGFDQARLDDEKLIGYTTDVKEAVDEVVRRNYDAAFILNPTGVQQVRDIADHGLVMPRKATYFYPKVTTGLVMNRLVE